jgi:5'-deoxynucleotidase YfbR-like HD superfamily hydrolase
VSRRTYTIAHALAWLRSGGTQRYHTHAARMTKTQDVAQHCYNVVGLAYMLTRGEASRELLLACLLHDAGEAWVGDVPSPTKRVTPEFRAAVDALETEAVVTRMGVVLPELSKTEMAILNLCDSLEGLLHCKREVSMGNQLAAGLLQAYFDYVSTLVRDHRDLYAVAIDMDLVYVLSRRAQNEGVTV